MPLKITNTLDEQVWRGFIEAHPQANVFHTPEMFRVFSLAHGHRPTLWAATDKAGQPLALLLPVQVTLQGGLLRPWTTRSVVYGSLLASPGPEGAQAVELLLREYEHVSHGKLLFTELRNLSSHQDLQPVLNDCGYIYEDHLNYLVNLDQPEDALWRGMSKSCRQRMRLSLEKGTLVEEVTSLEQLQAAYRQLQNVYTRVRVPLAHFSLFQAAFEICGPQNMCKVFIARVGEQCIGACFNLAYHGRLIAWYSGSDRAYASYNPGELLKWRSFQWGQAHGCHTFDFGGAGKPNEPYGPREFKAKFGGELVNFGRNVCIHSPLRYRLSKSIFALARKASLFGSQPVAKVGKIA